MATQAEDVEMKDAEGKKPGEKPGEKAGEEVDPKQAQKDKDTLTFEGK